jgi:DNA mismatch repair protein MutS
MVDAFRYTTERLGKLEEEITGAEEKIIGLEKKLFLELRDKAAALYPAIDAAAKRCAELDVAQSLAQAACVHGWTRPRLTVEPVLDIREGRHPIVEAAMPGGSFVPNDLWIGGEGPAFYMITGPNMAGKSTYLRQCALITLLAQIGSYVPASAALVGIADKLYCRVGASDNLARGESTFLVEMSETAYILNTATPRSLVIMDEVGRGTSTSDGLAIAWAVSEDLLARLGCRTLFATHYHELSEVRHPRLKLMHMAVDDEHGEIVFLRSLREGPAASSYGLHVARLAGLADTVLDRASAILDGLQARESAGPKPQALPQKSTKKLPKSDDGNLLLF